MRAWVTASRPPARLSGEHGVVEPRGRRDGFLGRPGDERLARPPRGRGESSAGCRAGVGVARVRGRTLDLFKCNVGSGGNVSSSRVDGDSCASMAGAVRWRFRWRRGGGSARARSSHDSPGRNRTFSPGARIGDRSLVGLSIGLGVCQSYPLAPLSRVVRRHVVRENMRRVPGSFRHINCIIRCLPAL